MGGGNPGVGAFQWKEVFYDGRDEGVLVCAEYVDCPFVHL